MRVAGQICSATSRALIHQELAPRVLARLKDRCAQVKACHPLTPERADRAYIGPIISAQQHAKVLAYIQGAPRKGATYSAVAGVQSMRLRAGSTSLRRSSRTSSPT